MEERYIKMLAETHAMVEKIFKAMDGNCTCVNMCEDCECSEKENGKKIND